MKMEGRTPCDRLHNTQTSSDVAMIRCRQIALLLNCDKSKAESEETVVA